MKYFGNAANSNVVERTGDTTSVDNMLKLELEYAGVPLMTGSNALLLSMTNRSEVRTKIVGELHGWVFIRYWRYWVVEGPGLDFPTAMDLWKTHGKYVRANGDAGCRSPWMWNQGFATRSYHHDTHEGLKCLCDVIKNVHASSEVVAETYGVLLESLR